jgi:hypothetical protein
MVNWPLLMATLVMRGFVLFAVNVFILASLSAALAADLPESYAREGNAGPCGGGGGYAGPVSPAVFESTRQAVWQHLVVSITISQSPRAAYDTSPLLIWANETKNYCGFASGFFRTGEFNAQTISQCQCFYSLMQHYMAHSGY